MVYSRSHRGRASDPAWPTIVIAILVGLIVARAVSTGFARRAVTALLARISSGASSRERSPLPAAVPYPPSAAATSTTSGGSSLDQADLTRTNEDVASELGPALDDIASGDTETLATPTGTAPEPFDSHEIPEAQPLDAAASAGARELAAGSDLPDSVPADGTPVCPIEYPIKGNGRSGIYHPPGAFAYERTVPSICFRTAEAAERAGFRAARH